MKYGNIPVIVAGGIYTHDDIKRFIAMGADGVQMGTRFLQPRKARLPRRTSRQWLQPGRKIFMLPTGRGHPVACLPHSLSVADVSADAQQLRPPKCDKGYVLIKDSEGKFSICPAKTDNKDYFCICNGLLSSAGYNPDKKSRCTP